MEILFVIALGWILTEFEPIQFGVDYLNHKIKHPIAEFILGIFSCWQCSTFWSGLIVADFKTAVIASFLTYAIEGIYDTWSNKR